MAEQLELLNGNQFYERPARFVDGDGVRIAWGSDSSPSQTIPMGHVWHHASDTPTLDPNFDPEEQEYPGLTGGGLHLGTEQAAIERTTWDHSKRFLVEGAEGAWPPSIYVDVLKPRPWIQHYTMRDDKYGPESGDRGTRWPMESPAAPRPYVNDAEDTGSLSLWANPEHLEHIGSSRNTAVAEKDLPTATLFANHTRSVLQPKLFADPDLSSWGTNQVVPYEESRWRRS